MTRIQMSDLNEMDITSWTDLDNNDFARVSTSTDDEVILWNKKQRLIMVTAIQATGAPITCQMWDASMADVAAKVLHWNDDDDEWNDIIRVFLSDGTMTHVASEWIITPPYPTKDVYRGITRVDC